MSPTRYTGRHRKPRQSRTQRLIRGGLLSGVLSTVAVSSATATGEPAEQPTEATGELPVVALGAMAATGVAQATEATERYVAASDLHRAQQRAIAKAEKSAAKQKAAEAEARRQAAAEAEARAAEARAAEEAAQAEAAERASRTAERAPLAAAEPEAAPLSAQEAPAPAASGSGSAIVDFARSQIGSGYQLGATGPGAWDCSSLTQAAYAAAGISLPRTSQAQSGMGTQIPVSEARPGDILYWGGAGSAYHVAIYAGGGTFIGAQNPSTGVVQQDLNWSPPTGAVRIG